MKIVPRVLLKFRRTKEKVFPFLGREAFPSRPFPDDLGPVSTVRLWTQPTKVAGTLRRAVRSSAFNGILGGRHMECAYYFDFCRLCHFGVLKAQISWLQVSDSCCVPHGTAQQTVCQEIHHQFPFEHFRSMPTLPDSSFPVDRLPCESFQGPMVRSCF